MSFHNAEMTVISCTVLVKIFDLVIDPNSKDMIIAYDKLCLFILHEMAFTEDKNLRIVR